MDKVIVFQDDSEMRIYKYLSDVFLYIREGWPKSWVRQKHWEHGNTDRLFSDYSDEELTALMRPTARLFIDYVLVHEGQTDLKGFISLTSYAVIDKEHFEVLDYYDLELKKTELMKKFQKLIK